MTSAVLDGILLPYQKAWIKDDSRFKIGMWSRQTGKSFATAAEAVLDCLLRPGQLWVCLSAGERQAFEWLRKARQWTEALDKAVFRQCQYREIENAADARFSKGEIVFPAVGDRPPSRILAIPANPDTARGYSANLILDEFAIHERSWDIWAAIYPSITSPKGGDKKLRIVSTPKGMGNKFADLWHKSEAYSRHRVTIEDAAAAGLGVDIAALKAGVDDADIWAQEYMCEFIDASGVLLPYDLIASCTLAEQTNPPARSRGPGETSKDDETGHELLVETAKSASVQEPSFIGMDIGRSHDLSVIVRAVRRAHSGILEVRDVHELEKMPFAQQLLFLKDEMRRFDVRHACIDATGIGAMLAEEARRELGARAEPVVFTARTKGEMYTALRRAFEERTVRIPASRALREDLHAVEKRVSQGGAVSYSAARNADGHSDRAAALALCLRAATTTKTFFLPRVFGRRAANPDARKVF